MLPGLPNGSPTDGYQADPITVGQVFQWGWWVLFAFSSYLSDCFVSQFGEMLFGAPRPFSSTFFLFVVGIGLIRSKKEVRGPNACSIVAFMEDKLSFWNWPIFQFPSNSMRGKGRKLLSQFYGCWANHTVTTGGIELSIPQPTASLDVVYFWPVFIDTIPKPKRVWFP